MLHLRPQDALTFGAAIQTARLMGGQIGQAFVVTLARVRGQVASNLIGLHVQRGDAAVIHRLQQYGAATARAGDPGSATVRSAAVLGNVVRTMATTQAVIDVFITLGALTAVALLVVVVHKRAPDGPASAISLFRSRTKAHVSMRKTLVHRSRLLTAIGIVAMTGCRVGPDYRPPATARRSGRAARLARRAGGGRRPASRSVVEALQRSTSR